MPKYAVKADERQRYVTIHRHPCDLIGNEVDWFGTWTNLVNLEKAEAFAREFEEREHIRKYCSFCIKRRS
jgi:hypothetical protein